MNDLAEIVRVYGGKNDAEVLRLARILSPRSVRLLEKRTRESIYILSLPGETVGLTVRNYGAVSSLPGWAHKTTVIGGAVDPFPSRRIRNGRVWGTL